MVKSHILRLMAYGLIMTLFIAFFSAPIKQWNPTVLADEAAPEAPAPAQPAADPVADPVADPSYACQLDINNANDSNPFTFTFSAINTLGTVSYDWDFGDLTTGSGAVVSHTYTSTGSFTIALICTTDIGGTLSLTGSVTITNIVTAGFSVSPGLSGFAPFSITTNNTSSGGGLTYSWEILDGGSTIASGSDTNISYTFGVPGSYTIRLTATDGAGQSQVSEANVVVAASPPTADFALSPTTGTAPLNIQVQGVDQGTGPITSWSWTFGDSIGTASGIGPHNYTYSTDGTYWVTLNYVGPGGSGSVSKQVGVFPASEPVNANYTFALAGNTAGGGVRVCFTNTSTGPIVTNQWTFGDGVTVNDNSAVVCHDYAAEGDYLVSLRVTASDPQVYSTADRTIQATAAPVAQFTASSTSITWGDTVNFDSTSSTGTIVSWAWDFNGDGTTDSTQENPSNIAFSTLGNNRVRLTVTGPGGSSYREMIIMVASASLSCSFTGSTALTPGSSANYDGTVGNLRGRTPTYNWSITGPSGLMTFSTEDIGATFATQGFYYVTFAVSTPDGQNCSTSRTVNVSWPVLGCSISGNLNPAPNGSSNNYTAIVSNLGGRTVTYEWYVDGALQGSTTNVLALTWAVAQQGAHTVRVVVTATNGTGNCESTSNLNVQWPNLSCNISGSLFALPQLPDNPTRSHTYTANISGLAGRSITSYQWTVDGAVQAAAGNTLTLAWAWNETGNYVVAVTAVVDNTDSTTVSCSRSASVNVSVPSLTCNMATGDSTPILDETVTFGQSLQNRFGRTITAQSWILQRSDGAGGWIDEATGSGSTLDYQFSLIGATYRVAYSVTVEQPTSSCTSPWKTVQAAGVGVDFSCDAWAGGNFSPASSGGSYSYTLTVDNTRRFPLDFVWLLVGPSGTRTLGTNSSDVDGNVTSPSFSGVDLGPADNYTLRVEVSSTTTSHTCSLQAALIVGTLTVNFTYTGNNNLIEVGQEICLTNTSSTSHNDINALTYAWNFGTSANSLNSQTSTDQQPGCFSFTAPGTYNVVLTGTNASGLRSANRSVIFRVYGSQSIALTRSNQQFAPTTMTFSATGTNVNTPYQWTFRNVDTGAVLGTRTGASVSFYFGAAGRYEAEVRATGSLGVTTAASRFELISSNDVRAAFRPSTYGGLAPLHVCFTDNSIGNGINSWTWDFGNGQTLSYNNTNIPSEVCADYTTPATAYNVQLTISNTSGLSAFASNVVRTYNVLESRASFRITPQGGGRYCFQAIIDPGISVTGWEFGEGGTAGAVNAPCYRYTMTGSYLVTMRITDGTTTGQIRRPVDVDLRTNLVPPALAATGSCSNAIVASFTVSNIGGSMSLPDRLTIINAAGTVVLTDDFLQLGANQSRTYTVSGHYGIITMRTVDSSLNVTTNCAEPPILSGSATCAIDGTAIFTITNTSRDTAASQLYTVLDANNNLVTSGSLAIPANGGSQEIRVANIYGRLNFSTSGSQGVTTQLALNTNCAEPPVLSGSASCAIDGTAIFTITNTSRDTAASQLYTILDANNNLVTSGLLAIPVNGGSQEVRVTNVYGSLAFSTTGTQGITTQVSLNTNCAEPPILNGTVSCAIDGTAIFVITNTSRDTAASQLYMVVDANSNIMTSGSLVIPANGGSQEVRVANVYGRLTMNTSGIQGATTQLAMNSNCAEPPVLSATTTCAIDGTAIFTITNSSRDRGANQLYEVRSAQNQLVQQGTLAVAGNNGQRVIRVERVYGSLTLTTVGAQGATTQLTANTRCAQPPMLVVSGVCENNTTLIFNISNISTGTPSNQRYQVVDVNNTLLQAGMLTIAPNGGVQAVRVEGAIGALTLLSQGAEGITTLVNSTTDCSNLPRLSIDGTTPGVGTDAGTNGAGTAGLPLPTTNGANVNGVRHFFPVLDLTPGAVDPSLERSEAWDGIITGGAICPDWLLYHTDMTGDWEVFRLGDLPEYPNADPNLSQGRGTDVIDMSPTRSPDAEWVAFTSNRDDNWELYVARVDNSEIRRVTYNTVARDIDPVWSPDGRSIIFETDRDGNWELYLLDLATGEERRLTTDDSSDINAFWSDDSSKVVFQSDRSGKWQIYEMEIATQEERLISDGQGEDHDPAYSFDTQKVAFRSYRDGRTTSAIYVMNVDGSDVQLISDPAGNASNHTWYYDDSIIAYQSDAGGDLDIYVYEFDSEETRLVTDNVIPDYAPTWICGAPIVVFTSDVTEDPNIFNTPALPIEAPAIVVDEEANQMTTDEANDVYPENNPTEENASREGNVPPRIGGNVG